MAWWREAYAGAARAVVIGCLLLGVGCGGDAGGGDDGGDDDDGAARPDRGDVEIAWSEPPEQVSAGLSEVMRDERLFEELAEGLNQTLAFPRDLPVRHEACDEVNASYDPNTGRLTMCYELLTAIATAAVEAMGSDDETGERIVGTWLFVFFHELGHALVDMYDLPITGKEEDSVDNFSTVLLIESGQAGAALRAAEYWASLPMGELDGTAFADEHSLNAQRFFNILCLVYGSDPEAYAGLVSEGYLPETRAVRCPAEYESQRRAWGTLLEPWSK